jgi:prepilin signal peptidase PulO-like enzyme (type II secretory pathway)
MLLVLNLVLVSLFMLIAVYDIRHTIIPDELTLMVGMVAFISLGYDFYILPDWNALLFRIGAGAIATFFFWGLWFVSKGRWIGLGDAKLAFPLGVLVGLGGVFSMVVFSFWIGALISVTLLAIQKILKRGKTHLQFLATPITIKSEVPFAPFLIAGFVAVHFLHADTFSVIYALFFN